MRNISCIQFLKIHQIRILCHWKSFLSTPVCSFLEGFGTLWLPILILISLPFQLIEMTSKSVLTHLTQTQQKLLTPLRVCSLLLYPQLCSFQTYLLLLWLFFAPYAASSTHSIPRRAPTQQMCVKWQMVLQCLIFCFLVCQRAEISCAQLVSRYWRS